jgi:hypothetical protein
MAECDVDEIMRQLKVLDNLKQLKDSMGEASFKDTFPELANLGGKLGTVIEEQERELDKKMSECGKLSADELTEPEPIAEPVSTLTDEGNEFVPTV